MDDFRGSDYNGAPQEDRKSIDLKPCPFCGDTDQLPVYDDDRKVWVIDCGQCPASVIGSIEGTAIAAWNTRHEAAKASEQPVGLSPEFFNSHIDRRLTKSGGIGFDLWCYILELETKAHDFPTGKAKVGGWRDYYENDYTPHLAIEEDFNYA